MGGYAFARLRFRGNKLLFTLCVGSMLLPSMVTLIPLLLVWAKLGLVNTYWPLILPHFCGGGAFNIFLIRQFVQTVPRELDEAATIDGCGYFRILIYIIVPAIKSAMIVVGLLKFIELWNNLLQQVIYIAHRENYTLALRLNIFKGSFNDDWSSIMCATCLSFIPGIVFYLIGQRYFVEGIVMTGMKDSGGSGMRIRGIPLSKVRITDAFWSPRRRLMTDVTIPNMERILRDEVPGRRSSTPSVTSAWPRREKSGEFYGMVFQDSDVARWLEAAAYSLPLKPALEERVDEVVALIGRCQPPDGYLNTYFTVQEPQNRWANLLEGHELYSVGHMLEASVALHEAAGKDALLRICIRLADHICEKFMQEEGIPGRQEIEIGLLRLRHAIGNARYRDMAPRLLDQRGQNPGWFLRYTPKRPGVHYGGDDIQAEDTIYNQSDVPLRERTVARRHAVRHG